jgi:uncharacterized lipoprotein YmbA
MSFPLLHAHSAFWLITSRITPKPSYEAKANSSAKRPIGFFDTWKEGKQMIEVPVSRLVAIFIVLILLGGCARSQPANYYILRSLQNPGPEAGAVGTQQAPAIGVGPVKIPAYLDRPQMATRSTPDSLKFAEFDKWAEPLEKNLTRVIADNLSVLVPSGHICIYPWASSMQVQYQITLEIIHLEKMPDGHVMLDASWNILGNGGEKLLVMKRSKLIMPVESAGFEAIASAESRAVEALSREIAAEVKSLPNEATPNRSM